MWALWVSVVGMALVSFYALLPDSHLNAPPPDMAAALAGDMAAYRSQLENYVTNNPTANGVVPESLFAQPNASNWTLTSQHWQNYVNSGIIVVYPATGKAPLPPDFVGAMLVQSGNSIEAGAAQNGQIVNPTNTGLAISLPAGMPPLSDGTPVWIAQVL